jgi:hypothetical protein
MAERIATLRSVAALAISPIAISKRFCSENSGMVSASLRLKVLGTPPEGSRDAARRQERPLRPTVGTIAETVKERKPYMG